MQYTNIVPPYTLDFHTMSNNELRSYYEWFISQIPERIEILTHTVKNTKKYEEWESDFSRESLVILGEWFSKHSTLRLKYDNEISQEKQMINKGLFSGIIQVSGVTLSDQTISLCFDIGIYFAESLRKKNKSLYWKHELTNKRDVNYGRAVLVGRNPLSLEPIRIMTVLSGKYALGKISSNRLIELFDIWDQKLT